MITFNDAVLFFTIYAFMGWVLESMFVSLVYEKKAVNRGFLHGFFCPIYGFGALLIIQTSDRIESIVAPGALGIVISGFASMAIVTVLEYITGYLLEKVFHCKWWDYSSDFANLRGYICLKNSLIWGIMAIILAEVVNPFLANLLGVIPTSIKVYIVTTILGYFLFDATYSVVETLNLRKVILKYANIPIHNYKELIIRYKRFFRAFPHLLKLNADIINRDVRSILNERIKKVKEDIRNIYQ